MHTNNTSLGYHLQDVQSESQHTENETILGDFCRLDWWHYSVEWLASSMSIIFQKCWHSCIQTHWCICILHPDAQINSLEGWKNMSIPLKVQSSGHSRLHCISLPHYSSATKTIYRTTLLCVLSTTSNPGDHKQDSQCYHAVKSL